MTHAHTGTAFRTAAQKYLPWVVTAGGFTLLFRWIPVEKVIDAAARVDLLVYLPLLTFHTVFGFFWDVLAFTVLFRWFGTPLVFREMLPIRGVTYLVSLLNYLVGQGGMALIMRRWKGIPLPRATSVVLFGLFIDYYVLLAFCVLGAFRLPRVDLVCFFDGTEAGHLVRFIVISWLVFVAAVWLFRGILPRARGWKRVKENELLFAFRTASTRRYLEAILLRSVIPLAGIIVSYFALPCFGLHVPFLALMAMLPIVWLIESIPISVMGWGTAQLAMLWLVARYAESDGNAEDIEAAVLAYSILSMIFFKLVNFAIGMACVPFVPRHIWALEKQELLR